MADTQYWREMDKAAHYPPERKAKAEAAALKAFKIRDKKVKVVQRIRKARTATQAFKNIFGN